MPSVRFSAVKHAKLAFPQLNGRVYPTRMPVNERVPAMVVNGISEDSLAAHSGPIGIFQSVLRYSVFSKTEKELEEIMRAIISVLDGFSGTLEGVEVLSCFLNSNSELLEDDIFDLDEYGGNADFIFTWLVN